MNLLYQRILKNGLDAPSPLSPAFKEDLKDPNRISFIFNLASFALDWEKQYAFINSKAYPKNIYHVLDFLKDGINIHYVAFAIVLENYKGNKNLSKIFRSFYTERFLTKKTSKLLKLVISIYEQDFKGMHETMLKTLILPKLIVMNEMQLVHKIFDVYKKHPVEFSELMNSSVETVKKDEQGNLISHEKNKILSYLDRSDVLKSVLNVFSAKDLFFKEEMHMITLSALDLILTSKDLNPYFDTFLNKVSELEAYDSKEILHDFLERDKKFFLDRLFSQNINRDSQFSLFNSLLNYASSEKCKDVSPFNNFVMKSLPKSFLENFLSNVELSQKKAFFNTLSTQSLTKALPFLEKIQLNEGNKRYPFLAYMHYNNILPENLVLDKQNHLSQESRIKLFFSFESTDKANNFIIKHFSEVKNIFSNKSIGFFYLLKKYKTLHYSLKNNMGNLIEELKDCPNFSSRILGLLLKDRDEEGNTPVFYASQKSNKDFFSSLLDSDLRQIKNLFYQPNNSSIIPIELWSDKFKSFLKKEKKDTLDEILINLEHPMIQNNTKSSAFPLVQEDVLEKIEPVEKEVKILPKKIERSVFQTRSFMRQMKKFDSNLTHIIMEEISNRATASKEKMGEYLKAESILKGNKDGARIPFFSSQGTPYRLIYRVKDNKIVLMMVGERRDIYDKFGRDYHHLQQETDLLFKTNKNPLNLKINEHQKE